MLSKNWKVRFNRPNTAQTVVTGKATVVTGLVTNDTDIDDTVSVYLANGVGELIANVLPETTLVAGETKVFIQKSLHVSDDQQIIATSLNGGSHYYASGTVNQLVTGDAGTGRPAVLDAPVFTQLFDGHYNNYAIDVDGKLYGSAPFNWGAPDYRRNPDDMGRWSYMGISGVVDVQTPNEYNLMIVRTSEGKVYLMTGGHDHPPVLGPDKEFYSQHRGWIDMGVTDAIDMAITENLVYIQRTDLEWYVTGEVINGMAGNALGNGYLDKLTKIPDWHNYRVQGMENGVFVIPPDGSLWFTGTAINGAGGVGTFGVLEDIPSPFTEGETVTPYNATSFTEVIPAGTVNEVYPRGVFTVAKKIDGNYMFAGSITTLSTNVFIDLTLPEPNMVFAGQFGTMSFRSPTTGELWGQTNLTSQNIFGVESSNAWELINFHTDTDITDTACSWYTYNYLKSDGRIYVTGSPTYTGLGTGFTPLDDAVNMTECNATFSDIGIFKKLSYGVKNCISAIGKDGQLWVSGDQVNGGWGRSDIALGSSGFIKASLGDVVDMFCTPESSLAVLANGALMGTGLATYTGNAAGDTTSWVEVMTDVVKVCGDSVSRMVLKTDGTLWFIGDSQYGHAGVSGLTGVIGWTQVATDIVDFHMTDKRTVYLDTDNRVFAAGINADSNFGYIIDDTYTVFKELPFEGTAKSVHNTIHTTEITLVDDTVIFTGFEYGPTANITDPAGGDIPQLFFKSFHKDPGLAFERICETQSLSAGMYGITRDGALMVSRLFSDMAGNDSAVIGTYQKFNATAYWQPVGIFSVSQACSSDIGTVILTANGEVKFHGTNTNNVAFPDLGNEWNCLKTIPINHE